MNRLTLAAGVALVSLMGCSGESSPPPAAVEAAPPSNVAPVTSERPADPRTAAQVTQLREAIAAGADLDKSDAEGRTLLMVAAFDGMTEVVEVLIENGAAVDQRDALGRTALMYASSGPFVRTVAALLDGGGDTEITDSSEGWTALMFAAGEGQLEVLQLLLDRGADATVADADGDTAIDHARTREQAAAVTFLQERSRQP